MKKILILFLAVILIATGCLNSNSTILDDISPAKISDDVLKSVNFPSAVEKSKSDLSDYFDFDTSSIKDSAYYICGSGAYPDELLIIKFDSSENAQNARVAVQARLDAQKALYRDYTPDEMYKLDGAVIQVNSNWLFFFALEDNAKVNDIINSYIKG